MAETIRRANERVEWTAQVAVALAIYRHDQGKYPESLDALRDLRPLGQIHDSFIVAAGRDGLWIVDQHVAHERILFEQLKSRLQAGTLEVQQLFIPETVELTAEQAARAL